jgi:hypothetical protein
MKDTALSENGRVVVGEWHGMCELAFNTAWEWHGICELAFSSSSTALNFLTNKSVKHKPT